MTTPSSRTWRTDHAATSTPRVKAQPIARPSHPRPADVSNTLRSNDLPHTQTGSARDRAPLTVDRRAAAAMLGISPRLLWTMTNAGHVPHVRIGARVLYPVDALRRWLEHRTSPGAG